MFVGGGEPAQRYFSKGYNSNTKGFVSASPLSAHRTRVPRDHLPAVPAEVTLANLAKLTRVAGPSKRNDRETWVHFHACMHAMGCNVPREDQIETYVGQPATYVHSRSSSSSSSISPECTQLMCPLCSFAEADTLRPYA